MNMPEELYPLHLNLMPLKEILEKILPLLKIDYWIDPDPEVQEKIEEIFLKTTCSPSQSIKSYLAGLASERNIVVTHNEKGVLLFTKLPPQTAVELHEDDPGLVNIQFRLNGQLLHNPITIFKQVGMLKIGEHTVSNPLCNDFRPTTKILRNGADKDIEPAAMNYLASEMKSVKMYIQTTKFYKPGTLISLISPSLGYEEPLELFVENIRIEGSPKGEKYSMSCIPKAVYYDVGDIKFH